MKRKKLCAPALILCCGCLAGCSINRMAADVLTGASAGVGAVFSGDPDPELVGDAIPFAIKMYEALLASAPDHPGLLETTGSLFVMYANAFIQGPAEMLPLEDYYEKEAALERAKKMYLRGAGLLYSALDKKYPGFSTAARADGTLAPLLKKCKKRDAGLLYWTVAGSLAALSIDIFDFDLGSKLPELEAMILRAYELDPDFGGASIDEFFVLFYGSLPDYMGGDRNRAQLHFERALEKTGGNSTGAYISYAQTICVADQDYEQYKASLEKALAVDVDAEPSARLVNILNQRKARFLLDTAYTKFAFLPIPGNL